MIIDYISDIHENYYFKHTKKLSQKEVKALFDELYKGREPGEVLIIAGDISEYNRRLIDFLVFLKKIYKYKKIFFTLGTHEFYLKTLQHAIKYHYSSEKKILELLILLKEVEGEGIHLLNGNIIEYKGIKFGGAMGWYDGSYAKKMSAELSDKKINDRWKEISNDYKFILNLKDYRVMYLPELSKINRIVEEVDVMITHINPLSEPIAFSEKYKKNPDNAFFAFDGEKFLQKTSAKYWIHGHTHVPWNFSLYETKILTNPLGYPKESSKRENAIKSILIKSN